MTETQRKLKRVRETMARDGLAAVRLKGVDWFSWATGGGSSVVIMTAEAGVAEVLITQDSAWILTNAIEDDRLRAEQVPAGFEFFVHPWAETAAKDEFVRDRARRDGGDAWRIASDRPEGQEFPLPPDLIEAKRVLTPEELERYLALGRDAGEAMTEAMAAARPEWTEQRLAGEGARALWSRGIEPTLVLVAGDARVDRFRHPTATREPLGRRAMMVFCGRRAGLYANLTRIVYFRAPTHDERARFERLLRVETRAWDASRPGARLSQVFAEIRKAYQDNGFEGEILRHHQGGVTGYLSREEIASPETITPLRAWMALAWNPSVPGLKSEDTVFVREGAGPAVQIVTEDPEWPSLDINGYRRPDLWVRT